MASCHSLCGSVLAEFSASHTVQHLVHFFFYLFVFFLHLQHLSKMLEDGALSGQTSDCKETLNVDTDLSQFH